MTIAEKDLYLKALLTIEGNRNARQHQDKILQDARVKADAHEREELKKWDAFTKEHEDALYNFREERQELTISHDEIAKAHNIVRAETMPKNVDAYFQQVEEERLDLQVKALTAFMDIRNSGYAAMISSYKRAALMDPLNFIIIGVAAIVFSIGSLMIAAMGSLNIFQLTLGLAVWSAGIYGLFKIQPNFTFSAMSYLKEPNKNISGIFSGLMETKKPSRAILLFMGISMIITGVLWKSASYYGGGVMDAFTYLIVKLGILLGGFLLYRALSGINAALNARKQILQESSHLKSLKA